MQKRFSLSEKIIISRIFQNALETLRQKEQERQQKEITIKEQRQHLEKLRSDIKVLSAQIAGLENKSSSLTANIENCEKVIAEQTEKFSKNTFL